MSELNEANETEANEVNSTEVNESHEVHKTKVVPLTEHIELRNKYKEMKQTVERLKQLEEEKELSQLSELEKVKKENEKLASILRTKEVKELKQSAYLEAKKSVGEGFVVEDSEELFDLIDGIDFNEETYKSRIANLVNVAKKPAKAPQAQVINMGANTPKGKDPHSYSVKELKQLLNNDRAEYDRVMAERKKNK